MSHISELVESSMLKNSSSPPIEYDTPTARALASDACMSRLQYETFQRVALRLSDTGSFLLADGTGVGKGRVMSAVAVDFVSRSRRTAVAWFSINASMEEMAKQETRKLGRVGDRLVWSGRSKNVHYSSYHSVGLGGRYDSLVAELHKADRVLLILDECHWLRRKNRASDRIMLLMDRFPHCDVLFVSATPASAPQHFHYMWRLLGSKRRCTSTISTLRRNGNTALECLTLQLKREGKFVSRQLSFQGVDVSTVTYRLDDDERRLYDRCAELLKNGSVTHQSFFRSLITSFKIKPLLDLVEQQLDAGSSVIVCIQSTGEACAARNKSRGMTACREYMMKHADLDIDFGKGVLDACVERFGIDDVSDITGRTFGRTGSITSHIKRFQDDEARIAVLSRAGSTGISLHAQTSRSRRRVQIVVEMPWTSEGFLQQTGRVHRANFSSVPKYLLLRTDVPSEDRFFTTLQSRLRNIGSITSANRYADSDAAATLRSSFSSISTHTKRMVATEIAYRSHAHLRTSVTVDVADPNGSVGTRGRRDVASHMGELYRCDDADRARVANAFLRACDKQYPCAALWRTDRWTVGLHEYTSPAFRRRVLTLLLVWRFGGGCVSLLPFPLLEEVIQHMCDEVRVDSCVDLVADMSDIDWHVASIPTQTTESFQNKMLCMGLANQHILNTILSCHRTDTSRKRLCRTFDDYLREGVDPCVGYEMQRRERVGDELHITVVATVPSTRVQPDACVTMYNVTYAVCKDETDAVRFYLPGRSVHTLRMTTDEYRDYARAGIVREESIDLYERLHVRERRKICRKARLSEGTYVLCLGDSMSRFDSSRKIILTSDSPRWGEPFSCLLLSHPTTIR